MIAKGGGRGCVRARSAGLSVGIALRGVVLRGVAWIRGFQHFQGPFGLRYHAPKLLFVASPLLRRAERCGGPMGVQQGPQRIEPPARALQGITGTFDDSGPHIPPISGDDCLADVSIADESSTGETGRDA